jgi:membrane protease YdiL (CAAX protease family)
LKKQCEFQNLRLRGLLVPLGFIFLFYIFLNSVKCTLITNNFILDLISTYGIYMIVVVWIYLKLHKTGVNFNKLVGRRPNRGDWTNIFVIVFFLILFNIGIIILSLYALSYIDPIILTQMLEESSSLNAPYPFFYDVLIYLNVIFIAPIVEEFLFRGIILNRLSIKWNVKTGIILSSLLFAILHFDIIGGFIFGLVMALIYIKTQSLWVPIICHILFNGVIDIFSRLSIENVYFFENQHSEIFIGVIFFLIALPWFIYYIKSNWPRYNKTPYELNSPKLI